ncbi:MAG: hypothetical protein BWY57_03549 [Betaproteobacteria bacterium ADurb.Bin341]|nr:MAG: hypothetical protein BWY57_03549 [Betaproteobacteria bacterium ADurb.Bin341]
MRDTEVIPAEPAGNGLPAIPPPQQDKTDDIDNDEPPDDRVHEQHGKHLIHADNELVDREKRHDEREIQPHERPVDRGELPPLSVRAGITEGLALTDRHEEAGPQRDQSKGKERKETGQHSQQRHRLFDGPTLVVLVFPQLFRRMQGQAHPVERLGDTSPAVRFLHVGDSRNEDAAGRPISKIAVGGVELRVCDRKRIERGLRFHPLFHDIRGAGKTVAELVELADDHDQVLRPVARGAFVIGVPDDGDRPDGWIRKRDPVGILGPHAVPHHPNAA